MGGALTWGSLRAFIANLGTDSALARSMEKSTGWETTLKTNAILADIFDMLQQINNNLVALGSKGKQHPKAKPYPRPGKDKDKKRKLGSGPMPVAQLREWIKGKQHGKR